MTTVTRTFDSDAWVLVPRERLNKLAMSRAEARGEALAEFLDAAAAQPAGRDDALALIRELLDTELGEMACAGSMAPVEDVLGRMRALASAPPQGDRTEFRKTITHDDIPLCPKCDHLVPVTLSAEARAASPPPQPTVGAVSAEVEGRELAMLKQLVEETIMVAKPDEDADGFISAYHFQTGAIHRLLAAVRTSNYPPHVRQRVYEYQQRPSYTPADPAEIAAYEERIRRDVIPEIEAQQRRKHGAALQRLAPAAPSQWSVLQQRFACMAQARTETADKYEANHEFRVANQCRALAEAYLRCADEMQRVLNGESPPPSGEEWPLPEPPDSDKEKT